MELSCNGARMICADIDETAGRALAEAQAIGMRTRDYERAYEAFAAKRKPVSEGN